jgi:hypothetical protein
MIAPSKIGELEGSEIPKLNLNTIAYHNIWKGSSDTYRLLSSLAAVLDGRLWHARDREAVVQLQDLLHKASGVYMRLRFTDKDDSNLVKVKKFGTAWKARQILRMTRGWFNVGWSMLFPSDPGYSIDMALDHPFLNPPSAQQQAPPGSDTRAAGASTAAPAAASAIEPFASSEAPATSADVEVEMTAQAN